MQRATLTAFTLLLLAGVACAEDAIRWAGDYRQAAELAARERKLVLLHFESDDCAPCKRLAANVFSRKDVADAVAANFVAVKINVARNPEMARRYSVPSWPQDVIVTPMGQEVYRQVSPQDPAEYIARLKETAARSGSAMARSSDPAKPQSATQPVGYQRETSTPGKSPKADLSSEFQPLEIENGTPSPAIESQRAAPQQNQYVAGPQTSPYSPQPGGDANRAAKPQIPSDSGTDYQGIERQVPSSGLSQQQPKTPAEPGHANGSSPRESDAAAPPIAPNKAPILPPIGMEGYCVVSLHAYNQKLAEAQAAGVSPDPTLKGWVKGNKKCGAIHRGRLYLFASTEAQKTFLTDPDRFAPALSGYDPVIFNETQKLVDGKRAIGLTFNGQVYIFASEESLRKFESAPKPFADTVYQAMLRSDQASKMR